MTEFAQLVKSEAFQLRVKQHTDRFPGVIETYLNMPGTRKNPGSPPPPAPRRTVPSRPAAPSRIAAQPPAPPPRVHVRLIIVGKPWGPVTGPQPSKELLARYAAWLQALDLEELDFEEYMEDSPGLPGEPLIWTDMTNEH